MPGTSNRALTGTIGSLGSGNSPSTTCRSVRQTPQASTCMRICPGAGARIGPLLHSQPLAGSR